MNIAKIIHQVNKALCEEQGDYSQVNWEQADNDSKRSITAGVAAVKDNPGISAAESHEGWVQLKLDNGWKYGDVKSEANKTHPCLVPFDELPEAQQLKDSLFIAIVNACNGVQPEGMDNDAGVSVAAFDRLQKELDELREEQEELITEYSSIRAKYNELEAVANKACDAAGVNKVSKDPKPSTTTGLEPKKGPKIS